MIPSLSNVASKHEPVASAAVRDRQRAFLDVLGRASAAEGGNDAAREAAEKFVALALLQPLLKEVRNSSWGVAPFAPSEAEKSLRALADARLAQDMVRAGRWPIVERLARDLRGRAVGGKSGEVGA